MGEEGSSLHSEEVISEEARRSTFDATEEEEGVGERVDDCSQEACLVHKPEIVTDVEEKEEEEEAVGKGLLPLVPENTEEGHEESVPNEINIEEEEEEKEAVIRKDLSAEKSLVAENKNEESEIANEIMEELLENAIESAALSNTDPEPSKSEAENFPLEGAWDEEDTWEDYDSEFDLEDSYVDFEIGVWSSALWTSDMKWENVEKVVESEEVVGWGVPFSHITSSNWSSCSSSGDEGARKDTFDESDFEGVRKDTFDESDFCDSPVNDGGDDSVSTDEGIVGSDDEVSEKAVQSEKIRKVIVDEPSPVVGVNTA